MKVLFIRLSSLGDIVLTEPCTRITKEYIPNAEIHYLTKPVYAEMVKDFTGVEKVHLWKDKIKLLKTLKQEKYDYIIDLQNKLNSTLIKIFAKSKKNITYKKQHILRQMIVKKLTKKEIDSILWNYLETISAIPPSLVAPISDWLMGGTLPNPTLTPNPLAEQSVAEIFENYYIPTDQYLIGIFPGAAHQTKQYPIEKFANFLLDIPDQWKCAIIVLGDWKDKFLALKLKSLTGMEIYDLTGAFTINQLIAAMNKLDIVITNDSGPMHIAAALAKTQIAIFGATHTKLGFRPLNENATIIQKDLKCRPCSLHGTKYCPKGHFQCMFDINSTELFKTFQEVFEKKVLGTTSETKQD